MKHISLVLTTDQKAALARLSDILAVSQSEAIRQALRTLCQQHGIDFPDNPTWGDASRFSKPTETHP